MPTTVWARHKKRYTSAVSTFAQAPDIVEHGRRTGIYITAPASVQDYVRQRKGRLRLSDGRILKFKCKALADGGRMMTFDDISGFVRAADQLRELAGVVELTKLPTDGSSSSPWKKSFYGPSDLTDHCRC